MKFVVFTLGCKVNRYESQAMMRKLSENGYEVSDKLEYADSYIINTCSVTSEADKKSRQAVGRALKFNPDASVYITGCSGQNDPMKFADKAGVKLITGSASKAAMLDVVMSGIAPLNFPPALLAPLPETYEEELSPLPSKTRGLLKIQDGCNNFCSYCVIPHLRGRSRSRALCAVVEEAKRQSAFTKELILTGINISAYGRDIGLTLTDLVRALSEIDVRKRFGSLECEIVNKELLTAMKEGGFCDHFHLSMQSGSNAVLKAMNRHYDREFFLSKVELIRRFFPDAGITTDIICGFPTETERDHEQTLDIVRRAAFSDAHVFVYSKREGTPAAEMPQIDRAVKELRAQQVSLLAEETRREFLLARRGRDYPVYFEEFEDGMFTGYTPNYIKVYSKAGKEKEIVNVALGEIYKEGVKSL